MGKASDLAALPWTLLAASTTAEPTAALSPKDPPSAAGI
jgi:hypothetical protein